MKLDVKQFDKEIYAKARTEILHELDERFEELSAEILEIVEELDGRGPSSIAFIDWDGESLLSAYGRLSSLRVSLSQIAAIAQSRSNYAMRWKLYQNSREWNPTKTALEAEYARLGLKLLKNDIESTLLEAFWETTQKEVFLQEIADRAKSLYDSSDRTLSAIKLRIATLEDEKRKTGYADRTM